MATVTLVTNDNGSYGWSGLAATDVGEQLPLGDGGDKMAVHASGTFGGTLTMQGTVDGSTWFTLVDAPGGSDVTFTADGYREISTAVRAVRPSAGSGVTDVDVAVSLVS